MKHHVPNLRVSFSTQILSQGKPSSVYHHATDNKLGKFCFYFHLAFLTIVSLKTTKVRVRVHTLMPPARSSPKRLYKLKFSNAFDWEAQSV